MNKKNKNAFDDKIRAWFDINERISHCSTIEMLQFLLSMSTNATDEKELKQIISQGIYRLLKNSNKNDLDKFKTHFPQRIQIMDVSFLPSTNQNESKQEIKRTNLSIFSLPTDVILECNQYLLLEDLWNLSFVNRYFLLASRNTRSIVHLPLDYEEWNNAGTYYETKCNTYLKLRIF